MTYAYHLPHAHALSIPVLIRSLMKYRTYMQIKRMLHNGKKHYAMTQILELASVGKVIPLQTHA